MPDKSMLDKSIRHKSTPDKKVLLVLGGARSGKSTYALNQAIASEGSSDVLFVATAEARDADMSARISAHKLERPDGWSTLECPIHLADGIGAVLPGSSIRTIIVDCLTLWVSNIMFEVEGISSSESELRMNKYFDDLEQVVKSSEMNWIFVSNEVGLGLIPMDPISRAYRDMLGRLNQRVAGLATDVVFLAAGLPLKLK